MRTLDNLRALVFLMLALIVLPAAASAQSTGNIAGLVTDTTSSVLPGVNVEAASPALIEKVRSTVTDGQGRYLIEALPPGTYRFSKVLRLGGTRVQGRFDLYNLFNAAAVARMNTFYGSSWLLPAEVMGGRLFKFGAQLDF